MPITNKELCCGCSACCDVCPRQCITMIEDSEGFLYPVIDQEKCIKCKLCEKVCPIKNSKKAYSLRKTYAAYALDTEIRMQSSSGGLFSVIAEYVLNKQGVIFGAAFATNFEVRHIRISDKRELYLLRGSKYVQSDSTNSYKACKNDLENGKLVLFTGTPCQVSALKSFLRKDYDNLLTMDIICHGVPSRLVWRKYIDAMSKLANSKIEKIVFRLKNKGWKQYAVRFSFSNSTAYCKKFFNDVFMRGFLQDLYLRPSCYKCKFKSTSRISDITIADYWGIDKINPKWDDDKGISLVVVHSEKGSEVLQLVSDKLFIEPTNLDEAVIYNAAMINSPSMNPKRRKFFNNINKNSDTMKLINKYTKIGFVDKVKSKIKAMIGK